MTKRGWKRVLLTTDRHCGHRVGLTPPGWQLRPGDKGGPSIYDKRRKWLEIQKQMWKWYANTVSALRPIHLHIDLGDMVDGNGSRSGGTELITSDFNEQVDMAVYGLRYSRAKNYCLVRGTPYHAGEAGNVENQIAGHLSELRNMDQVTIGDHEWPEVNGVVFDCKHKIGSSQIPHRNNGNLKKSMVWNRLWAEYDEQPLAQVFVRGHVHWYEHTDFVISGRTIHLATLPALQGMGSAFGALQCEGHVDVGLVVVDIGPKGEVLWQPHIATLAAQKASVTTF